jgi:hypothetical protein
MFRLRLPRNGSPLANALLVLAGVAAGVGISMLPGDPEIPAQSRMDLRARKPDRAAKLAPNHDSQRLVSDHAPDADPLDEDEMPAAGLGTQERGQHFREAGAQAAKEDLHQALASAAAMASAQDRLDFYRGIFGEWSKDDPEGALVHAKSEFAAGQLRSEVIGIAMNKWGQERPRDAWLWAEKNLQGPLKDRALTDLTVGWTRRNPTEAATWLAASGLTSQPLFTALPGTWAESDPAAAAAWVKGLSPGKTRDTAEVAVAGVIAHEDPAKAAEEFKEPIAEGKNPAVAFTIANIWATTDPTAAAEWVATLPEGPSKQEAAATLATVWASSDIQGAVGWTNQIQDPLVKKQVVSNIGTTWAAIDPAAALEWLDAQPQEVAADGITGAFYSWAGTDPVGLREWIDAGDAGTHADRARHSLADVLSQQNVPDALDLALGMTSEVARDQAAARYFREWRKRDDASAQDWLDANWASLPDSTRGELAKEQARIAVQK